MLDSVKSYPLYFVQKASPGEGDAFDFMLINRHDCPDIEQKAERIKQMFFDRGFGL